MDSSDKFKSYEKDPRILGLRALDVFLLILVKSSKITQVILFTV